ncbi:MAG: stage II sporulation protein R [Clostridia bacterium]|nr:stage II sporulation protein R [Clostridia bacterium]
MKKMILFCAMLLITTLFVSAVPTEAEGAVYEDTVRLHILANSDSEEDQELKLMLRDALLLEYGVLLNAPASTDEAEALLYEMLPEIKEFSEEFIRSVGYDYTVAVSFGKEWYETREYEDFTLPEGRYTSLKISIGEGEGKNWWCVMYPPLCLDIATESVATDASEKYTNAERELIGGKYKMKFKVLELFSNAFS